MDETSPLRFASFRDPAGRTLITHDRVLRAVTDNAWPVLEGFLKSPVYSRFVDEGRFVRTRWIAREVSGPTWLEHQKVPFPSYPYEWPPEMLQAAGHLTLDIAEALLESGMGLKDASPYNVLFRGPTPVFVDALSVEHRDPGDPMWFAYGQFVRNFLLPLLVDRRFSMSVQSVFLSRRDGIEPETVYRMAGPLERMLPPILNLATAPVWFSASTTSTQRPVHRRRWSDPRKAEFALRHLFRGLRRHLNRVSSKESRPSPWLDYTDSLCPYTLEQSLAKRRFIEQALIESRARRLLDVGCNTGRFSLLAAQLGLSVVAIDSDAAVVGRLWTAASSANLDVQPLLVDIARPSSATGWRNQECASFLERARGHFDSLLMLGLLHHLLINERAPLDVILDLAAELTTDVLLIEFIGIEDPMFQALMRDREPLRERLSPDDFERVCQTRFRIVRTCAIPKSHRVIFFLRKRA
jgi:2-polyprenyl-3-methyl-5-hydroxy-6-metoxy-1,4-benzoquinol methylase